MNFASWPDLQGAKLTFMIFMPTSEFLKRFRFQFPSYFRSFLFTSCPRVRFEAEKILQGRTSLAKFVRLSHSNKLFVSAEQSSSRVLQITPSNSPAKVYTSLCVATPQISKSAETKRTPDTPSLQIDECTAVERSDLCATNKHSGGDPELDPNHEDEPSNPDLTEPTGTTTPLKAMGDSLGGMPREILEDFTQSGSSQFCHLGLDPLPNLEEEFNVETSTTMLPRQTEPTGHEHIGEENINSEEINVAAFSGAEYPNFSITRQELLVISNFLERIPPEFITGEQGDSDQTMALAIVDDGTPAAMLTTSSQEETIAQVSAGSIQHETGGGPVEPRGKRRRPRYSLTGSMFKRHPVLKLSATGPLDPDRTPYKWWCRVCRVELSLMSRGSLELMSHYRSDSHLIKEHRIRMEIPGMPLYDKEEREILGTALQEAKKKAKEVHPIPPQLDSYRPLVGQDSIPDFSVTTSPTEKMFSQMSILEFGLRHGGNLATLTGVYDEMVRLTSSDRLSIQNWSQERVFVSAPF